MMINPTISATTATAPRPRPIFICRDNFRRGFFAPGLPDSAVLLSPAGASGGLSFVVDSEALAPFAVGLIGFLGSVALLGAAGFLSVICLVSAGAGVETAADSPSSVFSGAGFSTV